MSIDSVIDRRRLRRKLTFWRIAALVIAAIAIISAVAMNSDGITGGKAKDHIAKIRIEGTITEDEELIGRIADAADSDKVKGVILAIDSPGGTTAGGEAIFDAVRKLSGKKPVVAQVGTLAASAGYMIASAADHIVARQSSIVGSIGVIVQYPNVSELLKRMGIAFDAIKSAPLKAEPNPFNETTEDEREMMAGIVRDSFQWFVDLVTDRRPLSRSEVLQLADGSVFTGRQGLERKLVDSLGGEETAVRWLEEKGVDADLEVIEWKKPDDNAFGSFAAITGQGALADAIDRLSSRLGNEPLLLDGLVSVWHGGNSPDSGNSRLFGRQDQ